MLSHTRLCCVFFSRLRSHSTFVANTVGVLLLEPLQNGDSNATALSNSRGGNECLGDGAVRSVRNLRYFWRTGKHGQAVEPIFAIDGNQGEIGVVDSRANDEAISDYCGSGRKVSLWPVAGLAVVSGTPAVERKSVSNPNSISSGSPPGRAVMKEATSLVVLAQVSCGGATPMAGAGSGRAAALDFEQSGTVLVAVVNPLEPPDLWRYRTKLLPQGERTLLKWCVVNDGRCS